MHVVALNLKGYNQCYCMAAIIINLELRVL